MARDQASRFSSKCKVYAPMYRQLTLAASALHTGTPTTPPDPELAYRDVRTAWGKYLKNFNRGRGVVLIGHSQGAKVLTRLVQEEIDPRPKSRRQLVAAMLIGAGVLVPEGKDVGGSFMHIPACRTPRQTSCVVAYNSYISEPPANGLFGITLRPDMRVLCVNPNALADGAVGAATPYLPTSRLAPALPAAGLAVPATRWTSLPQMYTTKCNSNSTHTWLEVTKTTSSADPRPEFANTLGPRWGLHLVDINLNLGALVGLVGTQGSSWRRKHLTGRGPVSRSLSSG